MTGCSTRCCTRARWRVLVLATTLVAGWLSVVSSATGQVQLAWHTPPSGEPHGMIARTPVLEPASPQSGLVLWVDTRWANGYGYRPIQITVTAPQATTADHWITVRMHIGSWGGRRRTTTSIEQDFLLPLGSTSGETTIASPHFHSHAQFCWWEVWVDGVKEHSLSLSEKHAVTSGWHGNSSTSLAMLVTGPASQRRSLDTTTINDVEILRLPLDEFPTRWIEYTCLDVVAVSFSELERLATSRPDAQLAIRRWVNAGGQLWVDDVGQNWQRLPEVERTLQLLDTKPAAGIEIAEHESEALSTIRDNWRAVPLREGSRRRRATRFLEAATGVTHRIRDPALIASMRNNPAYSELPEESPAARREDSSRWFVEHPLGYGSVRSFRAASAVIPTPPPAHQGQGINPADPLATALRTADRWEQRHGLSPEMANADFANLLVPGVGLAPVTEFHVLITLFVLLIGPVNYWLLKRGRRLHLLVLTVPTAALLTTGLLFAYAVVSDGFSTRVRVHSYTVLDQHSGEATSWARQSYYAGLAPARGLSLPDDVVLYPIIPPGRHARTDAQVNVDRQLRWSSDEVQLARGWLRSRTPTQYLSVRAGQSPRRLEFTATGERLRAKNRLDTQVQYVVVVDDAGRWFAGEQIEDGALDDLQPTTREQATTHLRRLVVNSEPTMPLGVGASESSLVQRRHPRFQLSSYSLMSNLMNIALAELIARDGQVPLVLPARTYVAVTAAGPEVALGIPHAREESSFHVVVGHW